MRAGGEIFDQSTKTSHALQWTKTGCTTGDREKLSSSEAEPGHGIKSTVLLLRLPPFPEERPGYVNCSSWGIFLPARLRDSLGVGVRVGNEPLPAYYRNDGPILALGAVTISLYDDGQVRPRRQKRNN